MTPSPRCPRRHHRTENGKIGGDDFLTSPTTTLYHVGIHFPVVVLLYLGSQCSCEEYIPCQCFFILVGRFGWQTHNQSHAEEEKRKRNNEQLPRPPSFVVIIIIINGY